MSDDLFEIIAIQLKTNICIDGFRISLTLLCDQHHYHIHPQDVYSLFHETIVPQLQTVKQTRHNSCKKQLNSICSSVL